MTTSSLQNASQFKQDKHFLEACRKFSVARVLSVWVRSQFSREKVAIDGVELEVSQELSHRSGQSYSPRQPIIPWAALQTRVTPLTVAAPNGGGYLVGTETLSPVDIARPYSVVAKAGVTALPNLTANVAIPRTSGTSTLSWQSSEPTSISTSVPTLGQSAMSSKIGIGIIEVSRQLLLQSAAQEYLERELSRTAGTMIDKAVLAGTGSAGQPTGVVSQALSANIFTGASFTFANAAHMKSLLAQGNVTDDAITFIGTPTVRELLEARQRFSGSNTAIWDADKVSDRAALVSTDVPASTLIAADWSRIVFATWGEGFQIDLNPFDQVKFTSGVVQVRIMFGCDVALAAPGAIVVANSIT